MATVNIGDQEAFEKVQAKFSGQGGGDFFKLVDDGDSKVRRFAYETLKELIGHTVHEILDDAGKRQQIECLGDGCPLCAAGDKAKFTTCIALFNDETGEYEVWQRGINLVKQLQQLAARYTPLVATPVEIVRSGKKGDMKTTYSLFPGTTDKTTLADLPEKPDFDARLIKVLSEADMRALVTGGVAPAHGAAIAPAADTSAPTGSFAPGGVKRPVF
jgi:hypothetical protein